MPELPPGLWSDELGHRVHVGLSWEATAPTHAIRARCASAETTRQRKAKALRARELAAQLREPAPRGGSRGAGTGVTDTLPRHEHN